MSLCNNLINFSIILIMFSYKSNSYEKMEKTKPDKKFKQNSYEEIRKLVDEGGEMQLKETINTKKGKKNNENNIKFKFNLFD